MPIARQVVVNPANKAQRYVLYTNGYVQAVGGALQPTTQDASINDYNTNQGPPLWQGIEPARAIQVLDWTVPKGYTLDMWGNVWPWGGANAVAGAVAPLTGGPEYFYGGSGGFASPILGYVSDFYMDPSGGGTGYILNYAGEVLSVGTGVTAVPRVAGLGGVGARRLIMDWASKRYWILDNLGRISGYNGGNSPSVQASAAMGSTPSFTFPQYIWGAGGALMWGDFILYDLSATPKGWMIDSRGRVWRVGGAQDPLGYEHTDTVEQWSGINVIDDGTGANPLRLLQMTVQGRMREWVVSTPPVAAVTEPTGTFSSANKPWVGWQYIDNEGDAQSAYSVRIANSAAYLAGTTNEVQTVATSGAPTGGTFRLGFRRTSSSPIQATAPIAYNASAATVQAALEALPGIGTGGVACAGGPLGTGTVSVTFQNQMAGWNWPQMTLYNNSLTGGTSPNVTLGTTTSGVGADPAVIASVFSADGNDATTRVRSTVELANSTTYRAFVRVTDTANQTSSWDYSQFATAFTALNVPTVTPIVLGPLSGIQLNVSAATGAGLPGTARFAVQYHDGGGGSSGGLVVPGIVSTPDRAELQINGVIQVTARVQAADYTNSSQVIVSQWGVVGLDAWRFYIASTGALGWQMSNDGTSITVNVASSLPGFVDGTSYWVGIQYDTTTGAFRFYYAPDSEDEPPVWGGWIPLNNGVGPTLTTFNSTWQMEIGSNNNGGLALTGTIYNVKIRDDGVLVSDTDLTAAPPRASTFTDAHGSVWTVAGNAYIADKAITWRNVRGGDALVPASGAASVTDFEASFGVQRTYRAVTYVYDSTADLWQQSAWSASTNATLPSSGQWTLTNPFTTSQRAVARVAEFETAAQVVGDTLQAVNRADPIVLTDGGPKYPALALRIWSLTAAERATLDALCNAGVTLLLRNPFGESWYVRLNGEFRRQYLRAQPLSTETTPTRDAKVFQIDTQAVKRPVAGPTSGPLVEAS